MNEIKNYFERIVPMSDADWKIFSSKLTRRAFPKKSIILAQGKIENYLSFIEKGMIRMCIPKEWDDLTFSFEFEGNFFCIIPQLRKLTLPKIIISQLALELIKKNNKDLANNIISIKDLENINFK